MTAIKNAARCSLVAVLLVSSPVHAEDIVLTITGQVEKALKLTLTELHAMPSVKVDAKDHNGTAASYEGVLLHEVLRRAGVPQGESLHGTAMGLCALVRAADGYNAVFALPELDPMFTDARVLLAYRRNGVAFDAKAGPLRLVVPGDKRHNRWVRQV